MEKKTLPQELEAVLTEQAVRERPIRLMFQDEARFGRMARIQRCWAPAPLGPVVFNGYEREFTYVYGSVSPLYGELDWSLSDKMNTVQMAAFLSQVSQAHPQEILVMVVDGASLKGRWRPQYTPKLKKRTALLEKLREIFRRNESQPVGRVIERINPILQGWVNYFRVGHSGRCLAMIRDWVEKKIRRHLMRARKCKGFGWKRWSREWLHNVLGLFNGYRTRYYEPQRKVAPAR